MPDKVIRVVFQTNSKEFIQELQRAGGKIEEIRDPQRSQQASNGVKDLAAAYYLVSNAVGVAAAVGSQFYSALIDQNVQLEAQILRTATAVAATNEVFQDGLRIEDSTEAILALQQPIADAIMQIREGAFELVGVTSKEVIPLFEVLAGSAGLIGASIDESAQLSLKFAAALSTIGLPLYQANQEINSILRGSIDQNSVLAKQLGITNEMVQRWKDQGIALDELNKRLEPYLAGNKLLAQTIGGVSSNIQELLDEFTRLAGEPLLDPIVSALDEIYQFMLLNREEISEFAAQVGGVLTVAFESLWQIIKAVGSAVNEVVQAFNENLDPDAIEKIKIALEIVGNVVSDLVINAGKVGAVLAEIQSKVLTLVTQASPLFNLIDKILDEEAAKRKIGGIRADVAEMIETLRGGGEVSSEEFGKLSERLDQAAASGEMTREEAQRLRQTLIDLSAASRESAAATDIEIESKQKLQQEAQSAAKQLKENLAAVATAEAELNAALQAGLADRTISEEQAAAKRLANEKEIAQERLRLNQEALATIIKDEEGSKEQVLGIQKEIAQLEATLSKNRIAQEELRVKRVVEGVEAEKLAIQSRIDLESSLLQQQIDAQNRVTQTLQDEENLQQARFDTLKAIADLNVVEAEQALRRAEGTDQQAAAEKQLANARQRSADIEFRAQQKQLESQKRLIEERRKGEQLAIDLQQIRLQGALKIQQLELKAEKQQAALGGLTELEKTRLQVKQAQIDATATELGLLDLARQQVDQSASAEQGVVSEKLKQLGIQKDVNKEQRQGVTTQKQITAATKETTQETKILAGAREQTVGPGAITASQQWIDQMTEQIDKTGQLTASTSQSREEFQKLEQFLNNLTDADVGFMADPALTAFVNRINEINNQAREVGEQRLDQLQRQIRLEEQVLFPLQRQLDLQQQISGVTDDRGSIVGAEIALIDQQIQKLEGMAGTQGKIAALEAKKLSLQQEQEQLQIRSQALETQSRILELESEVAELRIANNDADLKKIELLKQRINLQEELLSILNRTSQTAGGSPVGGGTGAGIPGFAMGTNFAPGGFAMVGERGPEIVSLPRGSQVIPNTRISNTVNNLQQTSLNTAKLEKKLDTLISVAGQPQVVAVHPPAVAASQLLVSRVRNLGLQAG